MLILDKKKGCLNVEITFAEMYSGLGGMRYGLEKTNIENNDSPHESQSQTENTERGCCLDSGRNKRKTSYSCVWANDIDKYACQIYRKNFGDKELVEGDIRTIDPKSIPDFDLLTAGFPCQSFSLAGKRRGFEDTCGTLFYEVARIAEAKRPRLLLLENVKGLLSNDKGRTFAKIIQTLDDLGYDVEWQVLNSKYFGVPRIGKECSLSDILEQNPPDKYFLSENQTQFLLKMREEGKESHLVSTQTTTKEPEDKELSFSKNIPLAEKMAKVED
jgi:site-specific DNA-cytosine methylase